MLYSRISAFGAGRFAAAQSHWQTALDDAYGKVHAATPPGLDGAHLGAPVSQTSWIFGADRACSRSTYKLGDIQRLGAEHTLAGFEAFNTRWEKTLRWLDGKLVSLPRPKGSAAPPAALTSRLRVLKFTAKTNGKIIAALHSQSISGTQHSLDQLQQLAAPLRVLGTEFNRYGAKSCGLIVAMYGGKRPTVPGNGSTVNT